MLPSRLSPRPPHGPIHICLAARTDACAMLCCCEDDLFVVARIAGLTLCVSFRAHVASTLHVRRLKCARVASLAPPALRRTCRSLERRALSPAHLNRVPRIQFAVTSFCAWPSRSSSCASHVYQCTGRTISQRCGHKNAVKASDSRNMGFVERAQYLSSDSTVT